MNYKIGIDPGVNTGIAIVEGGKYIAIETLTITRAMFYVNVILNDGHTVCLYVEDPNLRKWYGNNSEHKKQGAGSVKRDFSIWKQFAKENGCKFYPVHPKDIGSIFDNEKVFKQATQWDKRSSKHSRDAARMIFKFVK